MCCHQCANYLDFDLNFLFPNLPPTRPFFRSGLLLLFDLTILRLLYLAPISSLSSSSFERAF